jgi:hypothetical protein
VVTTGVGYVTKKLNFIDKRLAAHEASDTATFTAFSASLTETKAGVTAGNEKLDRLITHMLENPNPSQAPRRVTRRRRSGS